MSKKLRIAATLLYVVSVSLVAAGVVYLLSPTIMPYHEVFLGKTHQQLDPRVAELFLFMIKGARSIFLSVGVGLAILVWYSFSAGSKWAWWTVFVMGFGSLGPMLFITLSIGKHTPWWAVGTMLILMIASLAVSRHEAIH